MAQQQRIINRLIIAYASAAIVIVAFIVASQAIIQLTLFQETSTRSLASTMALQELRTQAIFRNALLAILPEPYQEQLNGLKVNPVASLTKNLADVEATNKVLIGPGTPASVASQIKALQGDYQQMDAAGHKVLDLVKANDRKAAGTQIALLWPPQQKYLQGTYNAYNSLTQEADAQVLRVQLVEISIFVLSLATILCEILFVVRPAIRDYNKALSRLNAVKRGIETDKEEAK